MSDFSVWACCSAIVQMYLIWLGLVVVHEFGHVIAGTLVGYRFKHIIVGPLKVSRESGPVRLSLSTTFVNGEAATLPHSRDGRKRRVILLLGGPLATLLCAIVGAVKSLTFGPAYDHMPWTLILFDFMSANLLVGTVIPGHRNDVARIVDHLPRREEFARASSAAAVRAQMEFNSDAIRARDEALTKLTAEGVILRPREWSGKLIEQACELRDGSPSEAYAAQLAFYHSLDSGNETLAGEILDRALAIRSVRQPIAQATLLLDAAFYHGIVRRDPVMARQCVFNVPRVEFESYANEVMLDSMNARANGAIAYAEGHFEDGEAFAGKALDLIDNLDALGKIPGGTLADRAMIELLSTRCRQ